MKKVFLILISLLLIAGSYYFFLKNPALAPNKSSNVSGQLPVVIVPHFNVFAEKRAELLKKIGKKPSTAIVVSVNHFNSGSSNITTANREWTLSGGNVKADAGLVEKLSSSGIAGNDETAFGGEH